MNGVLMPGVVCSALCVTSLVEPLQLFGGVLALDWSFACHVVKKMFHQFLPANKAKHLCQ